MRDSVPSASYSSVCNNYAYIIIKKLLDNGSKKLNLLHKVFSNRNINLSAHRLLLLSVFRPSVEYGSEVWEGNKNQAGCGSLGVLLRPAMRQLEVNEPKNIPLHFFTFLS